MSTLQMRVDALEKTSARGDKPEWNGVVIYSRNTGQETYHGTDGTEYTLAELEQLCAGKVLVFIPDNGR